MGLIENLTDILDNLKSEIEDALGKTYTVEKYMRIPDVTDTYPIVMLIPKNVIPLHLSMEGDEEGTYNIEVDQVVKVPFDYDGSTLLEDLETLMERLKTLRTHSSYWEDLNYNGGVEFHYDQIDNWILQSASVNVQIVK